MRGEKLRLIPADEVERPEPSEDDIGVYSTDDEWTKQRRELQDPDDRYSAHKSFEERIMVRRNLQVQTDMTTRKWWDKLTASERKEYDAENVLYVDLDKGGFKCVFVLETLHFILHCIHSIGSYCKVAEVSLL